MIVAEAFALPYAAAKLSIVGNEGPKVACRRSREMPSRVERLSPAAESTRYDTLALASTEMEHWMPPALQLGWRGAGITPSHA